MPHCHALVFMWVYDALNMYEVGHTVHWRSGRIIWDLQGSEGPLWSGQWQLSGKTQPTRSQWNSTLEPVWGHDCCDNINAPCFSVHCTPGKSWRTMGVDSVSLWPTWCMSIKAGLPLNTIRPNVFIEKLICSRFKACETEVACVWVTINGGFLAMALWITILLYYVYERTVVVNTGKY